MHGEFQSQGGVGAGDGAVEGDGHGDTWAILNDHGTHQVATRAVEETITRPDAKDCTPISSRYKMRGDVYG